ncbi:hypothetical protein C2G38_2210691 [Gigaspora rosea]|uniref:Histidine kinase/HSP90-like ATPase domain-containing protein n=1 Tax=Gigaspora rosea TaxID=44941 RepID=A0A397UF35_9GLOM|nr:hypothetical protein C2G38_2210691 [Gigaspora rosea]
MVVLEVSDTGSRNEDTGIELALVKELITLHGGDITVTSVVNQGTTFKCWSSVDCLILPGLEADEISENDRKYKVLIVDNNNDMRDYLANLLNEFDVYRPCVGQDAI